jgi:16S rRNA C967 or C1407 C5-methylase (RsmB/RsmF family)
VLNLEEKMMATKSGDPSEAAINWESSEVAERRGRGRAGRAVLQGPATEMMLDLAEVRAGSRVLDVAAGKGDQTLMVAQRVGPTGYVLATDISASMLKLVSMRCEKQASPTSRRRSWTLTTLISTQLL